MTTLDLAAEIQYKKYIEQGYKPENIIWQRVKDINDVNKYILSDKYKDIALVAHSNSNSISLTYNALNPLQTINKDTVQYLRKVANKNVTLTIDWCLSWAGPNPIAKQIASHMDLTVKAPDSILNVANGDEFYDDGNEVLSKLSVKFWKQNIESLIAKNPANFITFQ